MQCWPSGLPGAHLLLKLPEAPSFRPRSIWGSLFQQPRWTSASTASLASTGEAYIEQPQWLSISVAEGSESEPLFSQLAAAT